MNIFRARSISTAGDGPWSDIREFDSNAESSTGIAEIWYLIIIIVVVVILIILTTRYCKRKRRTGTEDASPLIEMETCRTNFDQGMLDMSGNVFPPGILDMREHLEVCLSQPENEYLLEGNRADANIETEAERVNRHIDLLTNQQ